MISASNFKKTQEVLDVVEIKSEPEEAGGNSQENVRIEDVRSENSTPNLNLVKNPNTRLMCMYCPTTFKEPFGMAKFSNHLLTFHLNYNPENQSNISIPPVTFTQPTTPNIFQYPPPVLRRDLIRPSSTFIPSRLDILLNR